MVRGAVGCVAPDPCEVVDAVPVARRACLICIPLALTIEERLVGIALPRPGFQVIYIDEIASVPRAAVAISEEKLTGAVP